MRSSTAVSAASLSRARRAYLWSSSKILGLPAALDALGHLPSRDIPAALRLFGATVGADVSIDGNLRIDNVTDDLANLFLGGGVHIGRDVFLDLTGPLRLMDGVELGPRVCIITHISAGNRPLVSEYPLEVAGVTLEAGASVGAAAVITHGVTIGQGAVIAAHSLVNRHVRPGSRAAGIPAR